MNMSSHGESLPVGITRRQTLHAQVIRSCAKCGAPGYWHTTPGVNPGCYAPDKVTQLGSDPVGDTCPNCLSPRPPVEDLGEVWTKFFGLRVAVWWAQTSRKLQPLRRFFR